MLIEDPYMRPGYYIRKFLEDNGYEISSAIEIGSTEETTIFNSSDKNGIIISQDIKKDDIPGNVTFYEGGMGIVVPELDVFAVSPQLKKQV